MGLDIAVIYILWRPLVFMLLHLKSLVVTHAYCAGQSIRFSVLKRILLTCTGHIRWTY